jgi:hypothetical protein
MRNLVIESDLPRACFTLANILEFRTFGCQFHFTPLMVAIQAGYSLNTARRHIDILVSHGVLTKVATARNESGRSGTYLLHTEKLVVRPELQRYSESGRVHLAVIHT